MVGAGLQSTTLFLSIVEFYRDEQDYSVFATMVSALSRLLHVFDTSAAYGDLQKLIRHLMQPTFERLGWKPNESDSHLSSMMRSAAISLLGYGSREW
jgi:hypothetical protein